MDVSRPKRRADLASDHHPLMDRCRLQLKKYNTSSQKRSYKYNLQMLKDGETKNRFQHIISNKYQALAGLQENKQHLGKGETKQ